MRPSPPAGKIPPHRPLPSLREAPQGSSTRTDVAPCYWQAVGDGAKLFAGPLGEVVGHVEVGMVIKEVRRFQDAFGGWWIGTPSAGDAPEATDPCDVGEASRTEPPLPSPSLVWVSYNDSHCVPTELVDWAEPQWIQVYADGEASDNGGSSSSPRANSAAAARTATERKASEASDSSTGSATGAKTAKGRQSSASSGRAAPGRRQQHQDQRQRQQREQRQPMPIPVASVSTMLEQLGNVASSQALREFARGGVPGVGSDVDLFTYFWETTTQDAVSVQEGWNQRYQTALEDVLFHHSGVDVESLRKAQYTLAKLLDDFSGACQQVAVAVVEHMLQHSSTQNQSTPAFRGPHPRGGSTLQLSPHPAFPDTVFYWDGLLVRLCRDTTEGFFGGELRARKFAQAQFRGAKLLSVVAARHLLSTPLSALVDFEGYHLLVSTIPPITKSCGCVYSPFLRADEAGFDGETPAAVQHLVKELSTSLNLKEHTVKVGGVGGGGSGPGSNREVVLSLPAEAEVYAGRDRRLYLFNANRVAATVPELGAATASSPKEAGSAVVDLYLSAFRPEMTTSLPQPVNPNTGVSAFSSREDVQHIASLTDRAKTVAITACAGMIGMHLPIPEVLRLPRVDCNRCHGAIDRDELRFVVCRSPQECCHICAQCYCQAVVEHQQGVATAKGGRHLFQDAVTCWHSSEGPRPLEAVLMQPSIADLAHVNGLPMRHLAYVYHRLPTAARPFVAHFLEVEMVSRTAAQLLRSALRGAATPEDARATTERFFTTFLQRGGPTAERLWAKELGPLLERKFGGIVEPFSTETMSRELLLRRTSSLAGIVCTSASLSSFSTAATTDKGNDGDEDSDKPFLQLQAVNPRVRTTTAVHFPLTDAAAAEELAKTDVEKLHSLLGSLLLFWIGYTPEGHVESWQPRYLEELMHASSSSPPET